MSLRMYQGAWEQLKSAATHELTIVAHKQLHDRIYKAIRKERFMDSVFKLLISENCQTAKLSRKSVGNKLIVRLNLSLGLDDL